MLSWLRNLWSALFIVAAPLICHSKTIVAKITGPLGDEISVQVRIDQAVDSYLNALAEANLRLSMPCRILKFKAECYEVPHSLVRDLPIGFYGLRLVLTKPVSAIMLLLDPEAAKDPYDNVSLPRIRRLPGASLSISTARKAYPEVKRVYNEMFSASYNWTYERLSNVRDADVDLKVLAELAALKEDAGCSEDIECGGVYKFTAPPGQRGYAYCAYRRAGDVATPPYDCVAIYFSTPQGEYLAAFVSPFIGEAFGNSVRGLNCFVEKSSTNSPGLKDAASKIIEIFKSGKSGITLSRVKPSRDTGFEYLAGVRRSEPSNIFLGQYEYTTAILELNYGDESGKYFFLTGTITVSLADESTGGSSLFAEPQEAKVKEYRDKIVDNLIAGLSTSLSAKAACGYL